MDENLDRSELAQIVEQVNFSEIYENEDEEKRLVGLWLSEAYKLRFDVLQRRSKKKFGRLLKDLIEICINRAEAAAPKAG